MAFERNGASALRDDTSASSREIGDVRRFFSQKAPAPFAGIDALPHQSLAGLHTV